MSDPSNDTLARHVLRLIEDNGRKVSFSRGKDGRVRVSTSAGQHGVKWSHECSGEDAEYRALCMLAGDCGIDLE